MRLTWRALASLALAGCAAAGSAAPSGSGLAHPAASGSMASARELALKVRQPIPERNLYMLAEQLTLHPPRSFRRVVRTTSPNYPVGHQDVFKVLSEDENRYFNMSATIRAETAHIYLYVQNGVSYDPAAVQRAAQRFEHVTYPTDRAVFGSEWNPGVDGDPHITCLVGDLRSSGAAGFYSAEDEYPHIVNPYSNQREMIYINATATMPGDGTFDQTLAHEFQHMIHWHMHPHDNAWVNEGMSMLAEQLNNFPPVTETAAYLDLPSTDLQSWSLNDRSTAAHYGAAFLYLLYLYDRYGPGLIRTIVADSAYTDMPLIDDALRKAHINDTGRHLFSQWTVANLVNNRTVNRAYGYTQKDVKVNALQVEKGPFTYHGSTPVYAPQYIDLPSVGRSARLHLRFHASTLIPLVAGTGRGPFWWSNRGDMSDTMLQRGVDLRRVHHATLSFQAWYDIERDYDYGYVEASTDGGTTWTTLRATTTTATDPNGANYGNGFTGGSHGWRSESVDLSRYGGKKILVRFQYITDDEYNGQGLLLRHLNIPQTGWHDDGSGWTAQGFLNVTHNALPDKWTVQLVEYGSHGITVGRLALHGASGSVTLRPKALGLQRLVVIVFHTAPKTTATTRYTVSGGGG